MTDNQVCFIVDDDGLVLLVDCGQKCTEILSRFDVLMTLKCTWEKLECGEKSGSKVGVIVRKVEKSAVFSR